MNSDRYPIYGVLLVAGAAVAVWAGMPVVFLLFLACPLMMFFMMKGMGGRQGAEADSAPVAPPTRKTSPLGDVERP